MNNEVKVIDIKNGRYYFFNDIIHIKNFDPKNVKIDEKSYKIILIYYIGYVMIKDSKYVRNDSVNHLYLIFKTVNGYFKEINGNKHSMLVPTKASKEIKRYEELWIKIRDLIRSITENSNGCDEKFMRIKFTWDYEFPLNKLIEIRSVRIVVRAIFLENYILSISFFYMNGCIKNKNGK